MGISYPKVERAAVDGFLKVYNRGGLHLLFDNTSRQAMQDFANIALKSYVDDLIAKSKAAQAAKTKADTPEAPAPTPVPEKKSSIILTD
jgi:hypothetical protein